MNKVKLLHIKCCFFQFFNSPVALENKNKIWPPQEKVEMTLLRTLVGRLIIAVYITNTSDSASNYFSQF